MTVSRWRRLSGRWARRRALAQPGADHTPATDLQSRLAPYLADETLLAAALAHRSYCAERPGTSSNERLEFLGDAVLGIVVTEYLYRRFPDYPEGDLARLCSAVVSTAALAPLAADLSVGAALLLGRGEDASGGRSKASILADALEALIGAVYLSGGLEPARSFVEELLVGPISEAASAEVLGDPKNHLQEVLAQRGAPLPSYAVFGDGPDHDRRFRAEVRAGTTLLGRGEGRSKKDAERAAAVKAVAELDGLIPPRPQKRR